MIDPVLVALRAENDQLRAEQAELQAECRALLGTIAELEAEERRLTAAGEALP